MYDRVDAPLTKRKSMNHGSPLFPTLYIAAIFASLVKCVFNLQKNRSQKLSMLKEKQGH